VSVDPDDGHLYFADQIALLVERRAAPRVEDLVESYGFDITYRRIDEGVGTVTLVAEIPLGSVDDAVRLFEGEDGVISAERNRLGELL
jgi:hypothetical protein